MDLEVVSYSEIDTYRQCRLKHQLSYIERWRSSEEAEALARGTLFHSVMEAHYGTKKKIVDEGDEVEAQDLYLNVMPFLAEEGTGAQTERQELVEWMYRGYVELYGLDGDWEIVAVERPLTVPLRDRQGRPTGLGLSGTVDLLVKDHAVGSGLWIVDHKTCKNLPKQKDFDMEDQTAIYTYLLKQEGLDVRGAIYNYVRTYKLQREMSLEERFLRHRTVRTDPELETITFDALELMQEAYNNHDQRVMERGEVYDAPRTPDGERCGWKCGYTEACIAGRKYGPQKTRDYLEDIGFVRHDTKPGPTFNKDPK